MSKSPVRKSASPAQNAPAWAAGIAAAVVLILNAVKGVDLPGWALGLVVVVVVVGGVASQFFTKPGADT